MIRRAREAMDSLKAQGNGSSLSRPNTESADNLVQRCGVNTEW